MFNTMNHKEKIEFYIRYGILIGLSLLAWFGLFDKMAYSINEESLKETLVVFATIKGFSALISFANSVAFIGAIFEPFNEFLDRISWVMLLSLMSLGLQKIFLVALQSFAINFTISLSLVIVIFNKFIEILSNSWANKLLKFTIILIVIRFSIPIMALMVSSIETNTKSIEQEASQERLEDLKNQLFKIENYTKTSEETERQKEIENKNIETIINTLNTTIATMKKEIKVLRYANKGFIGKVSTFMRISDLPKNIQDKILDKKKQIEEYKKTIKQYGEKIETHFINFKSASDKVKTALINLETNTKELFDIFTTSVVLFLFKNVIFPLLFLWGLVRIVDSSFQTTYTSKLKQEEANKQISY